MVDLTSLLDSDAVDERNREGLGCRAGQSHLVSPQAEKKANLTSPGNTTWPPLKLQKWPSF